MLEAVKANKEKIGETIRTIRFSNKLIKKFCKRIEKYISKFNEKEVTAQETAARLKQYTDLSSLTAQQTTEKEEIESIMRAATKTLKYG